MALLTTAAKDALVIQIVGELSSRRAAIDIGHQEVRSVVDEMDGILNIAEGDVLAAVSPGASTWLTAHQAIAREIIAGVEVARKENL